MKCTDQVVGDILSSWRYDISGITPEMRGDYEAHLADCAHCSSRQRLHRTIDVALVVLSTCSALAFLLAYGVLHRLEPMYHVAPLIHMRHAHAVPMQMAALAGFIVSLLAWVAVVIATPAPVFLSDVARERARELQQRIRLPLA